MQPTLKHEMTWQEFEDELVKNGWSREEAHKERMACENDEESGE